MRKRICPYCDQELEGRYCRGCRRFVKTPLIVDVNYYLNERHPASEESCQYHGDLHTGEMGGGPDRRAPYEDVEKAGWPGSKAAAAPKAKGKEWEAGKEGFRSAGGDGMEHEFLCRAASGEGGDLI